MKQVYKIDEGGYYIEPVILVTSTDEEGNPFYDIPEDCIEEEPPSYYKAQWTGSEWVEAGEAPPPAPVAVPLEQRIELLEMVVDEIVLGGM